MNLLIWSIIISFCNMLSIKYAIKLISWFIDNNKEDHKIASEISFLKEEQSHIFIVKEFAKHAKLQRKINKLTEELKNNKRENAAKNLKFKLISRVCLFVSTIIINFLFVYYNYRQSVMDKLPPHWFSPLSWVVSWPLHDGTMSFLFWYTTTNCVAKVAANNIF